MKPTTSTHRAHAFFSGRVQGVGFRHEAESVAHRIGLTGWVKNLQDGRVEVVCEGSKENIDRMFSELQDGPMGRHVKKVDCVWEAPTNKYQDFCVEFCD